MTFGGRPSKNAIGTFFNTYDVGFDQGRLLHGADYLWSRRLQSFSPDLSDAIVDARCFHCDNAYFLDPGRG